MSEITTRDHFRGCLLGLATGDALGTTLEFKWPGTFEPIDDMIGGGPFNLEPGQWADDTSMALCLATSLIGRGGFDAMDQMQRYVRWCREGYLSATGSCFDIGNTVASALSRFRNSSEPYSGATDEMSAGNGSLMRLAPVPMYFAGDAAEAIDRSADSSRKPTEPKKRSTLAATSPACLLALCMASTKRLFSPHAGARWEVFGKKVGWRKRSPL